MNSEAAKLASRAARATWWGGMEIAARHGLQFVVMLVLARLLAPADFGLVAMLLVFTSLAGLLVDAGLPAALIQRGASDDDEETTVFVFGVAASAGLAVALWLGAPAIAAFYRQPALVDLMHVALAVVPFTAIAIVPDALFARQLDFRARARAESVGSLVGGSLAIVLAWRGYGVWSLAWMAPTTAAVRSALLLRYSGWRPRGRFRGAAFRDLFSFSGYYLASNLLNVVFLRLQSLLIGRFFDSRVLGYYTLAQNSEQVPSTFVATLLNRVGLPVLSQVAADVNRLREALRRALRLAMFVFMPAMIGIALAAERLVTLLYGPGWEPVAPILALLTLGSLAWPMHVLNIAAINALGRADLFFRLTVVKKISSIALVVVAAPFGPIVLAWALLAANVLSMFANAWYPRRLINYGLLMQVRDQLGTAGCCAVAAGGGWATLHWLPQQPWGLLAAAIVGGALYLGAARLMRHEALPELATLLRSALASAST
jgi:O-antigen/teichoic acid export membrane protein